MGGVFGGGGGGSPKAPEPKPEPVVEKATQSQEEAGARMGLAPAPPELLPSEALPEAQKAYESFFRNAPEKFTEEAARVAAQQAEARAADPRVQREKERRAREKERNAARARP
jgi:hypothetical protein